MQVVKETWLLRNLFDNAFMCGQNTTSFKLYASEHSAISSADYFSTHHAQGRIVYEPVKAFIVIEDEIGE